MYKIMYYYKRYIEAAPLQKGYQRIINLANSEAKTNQVKPTERLTSRISTTDQATQTDNDQTTINQRSHQIDTKENHET